MSDDICIKNESSIIDLQRRCNLKEIEIKRLQTALTRTEAHIDDLKLRGIDVDRHVVRLIAWKNRAVGYLTGIGAITYLLIDYIKEQIL